MDDYVSSYALDITGNTNINGDLKVTGKIIGGNDMMGLYEVYVVNTKKQNVHHQKVFAKDEVGARVKALRMADPIGFPDDDVEIFVNLIGQWTSKKPKEVKIVKE